MSAIMRISECKNEVQRVREKGQGLAKISTGLLLAKQILSFEKHHLLPLYYDLFCQILSQTCI